MKKLLLCLLTLLLMVSCELETSSNGDLDGLWHLCSIETADSVQDISDKTIFWAVQVKLLSVRGAGTEYLLRFHLTDDSLLVRDPYVSDRFHQMGNDSLVTDPAGLYPYGIFHLQEHFKVERLTNRRMTLKSDKARLRFKKF